MPADDADFTVRVVGETNDADASVLVVNGIVVDLTGATPGDVITVQGDGSLGADPAGAASHPNLAAHDTLGLATQTELDNHTHAAGDATTLDGLDSTAFVTKASYDANTLLAATADDAPVALTVDASRIVGRKATGDIAALTAGETLDLLEGSPAAWTAHHTFSAGIEVTDDDGTTAVNGWRALAFLRPPTADDEVVGLLVKTPDAGWGVGQDYTEGNAIVVASDADTGLLANPSPNLEVISATTNAAPVAVTTTTTHGWSTGDMVRITGTAIAALDDKWWKVTVTSTTAFTLDGSTAPGSTAAVGYAYSDRSPMLFRVDGNGGVGFTGGMHVATGLRGRAASASVAQSVWIDPSHDAIGIIFDNPTATEWAPTPTADYLTIRDARSSPVRLLCRVNANGQLVLRPREGFTGGFDTPISVRDDADTTNVFAVSATGTVLAAKFQGTTIATTQVGLAIVGMASATVDTAQFTTNAVMTQKINRDGAQITKMNAAIVDARLAAGEFTLWLDQTVGATALAVKAKDSAGTAVTQRVALGGVAVRMLTGSVTWDPANLAVQGANTSTTVTVTGAAVGDPVAVSHDQLDANSAHLVGHVESANTVRVSLENVGVGAVDIASGTLRAIVFKVV